MQYQWDIIGHREQLEKLEEDMKSDQVGHAYLFSGPRKSGKFPVARRFAAFLQCAQQGCGQCKECKAIVAGTHPDVMILKDEGDSLKIDAIRDLIAKSSLSAHSPYRIFLIENIERMPIEAQNAFLKTLEEPPGKTIFIMTTSHINQVLPTIQSRVRHHYFFGVDDETLKNFLKKRFKEQSNWDEIINIAQGRPGLAISLIENPAALEKQRQLYVTIENFLKHNGVPEKFRFVDELVEGLEKTPGDLDVFFDALTRYLRKLLLEYTENPEHPLKNRFSIQELVNLFESLEKTRYLIGRNVNKKMALENWLLQTEK